MMKKVHILNPAAGKGGALRFKANDNVHITECKGDAKWYVEQSICETDGEIDFYVYGGDGTVNEVASGIMASKSDRARMCIQPCGSGNDLVRTVNEAGKDEIKADVLTLNDGYAVNVINTGFDLDVVLKAAQYKKLPLVSGSLAYVLGIANVLGSKMGRFMRIKYYDKDGEYGEYDGECLLVVAANARYYGGGFLAAPAASITDGLIDLLIVKKMSRMKFLALVAKYKKGDHIDLEKMMPREEFSEFVSFSQCKSVVIEGIEDICADGDVIKTDRAEIGIIPSALRIIK